MDYDIEKFKGQIKEYAAGRAKDVERGAETPRLAATLLQKYGTGVVDTLVNVYDKPRAADEVLKVLDQEVARIDPNWVEHMHERWEGRPADILKGETSKSEDNPVNMDELKFILANLLDIEAKILKQYDYDKYKAQEHTGYKEIVALSIEITDTIKKEEEKEIIDNSFLL